MLECVSVAEDIVPPSFCLKNGSKPDLRISDDDFIISDNDSVSDHESLSSDEGSSSDLILSNARAHDTSNDCNNNCDLSDSETEDQDTRSHETVINNDQIEDRQPVSGLMVSIANLESSIIHMTCSATAKLNLYVAKPPRTVSYHEDSQRSHQELLDELRLVRNQLSCTHQALGCTLGQLSASNAHCTTIHREDGNSVKG